MISIKKAEFSDARDFAYILCESWKSAYKDIISEEELAKNTDIQQRTAMFEKMITSGRGYFYIAFCDDIPCGLISFGNSRDEDLTDYMEIVAIYTLENFWGKTIGNKLMDFVLNEIKNLGYKKIMLWVFEKNKRARRFYEKHGFTCDNTFKDSSFVNAKEIRYTINL